MLKRTILTIGIAAVLLTGISPAGGACALGATVDHACCAEMALEPSTSCCSSADTSAEAPQAHQGMDCSCLHQPESPATTVVANGPITPDEDGLPIQRTDAGSADGSWSSRTDTGQDRVRSHPSPPAYLLNCANLN